MSVLLILLFAPLPAGCTDAADRYEGLRNRGPVTKTYGRVLGDSLLLESEISIRLYLRIHTRRARVLYATQNSVFH